MFRFFSPSNLFIYINKSIGIINTIIIPIIIVSVIFALIVSPEDYIQGDSVRIMYVHVPSAWLALMIFSLISFMSILSFLFKFKNTIIIFKSLAPIGLSLSFIAIVTGSLWGQPTWGTFWVWDARLTSMLVLMFFYILFIFSYKFVKNADTSLKICTGISILGLINVFIIKYSVDLWQPFTNPQHKDYRIFGDDSSMLLPLCMMLFVFLLYCALIFLMKYKTEVIRMKKKRDKKIMNLDIFFMNGYGAYVWLSFAITFFVCLFLFLKTRKTLKKLETEFKDEANKLSEEQLKI